MMKNILLVIVLLFPLMPKAQEVFSNFLDAANAGGKSEFNRMYKQELIYPAKALKSGAGGTAIWRFKVNKDGTVSDFKRVETSSNKYLDQEAKRLIMLMDWKPAENGNEKKDSYVEYPVSFDPKSYKGICKKRGYPFVIYPYEPYDTTYTVYNKVEKKAKFKMKDKDYDLGEFLGLKMKYPKEAEVRGIKGTVTVSFIIEPSGMVTNTYVLKGVGGGCSEEALRLVQQTRWVPAMVGGMYVRSRMNLPISFQRDSSIKDGMNREQRTF